MPRMVMHKDKFKQMLGSLVVSVPTQGGANYRRQRTVSRLSNHTVDSYQNPSSDSSTINTIKEQESDEKDEEEEMEFEEYMADWTDSQRKTYAVFLLLVGTVIVSIFSDPMVDVLNNFGHTIGVSPFYVSFIVTPLASNAAEVLTGVRSAAKKTNKKMGMCANALYGAATMNCTFCLAIFLGLVYGRGLSWDYTAEVSAILLVIWIVGIIGLKDTHNMKDALVIGMLFPISIVFIWFLENVCNVR